MLFYEGFNKNLISIFFLQFILQLISFKKDNFQLNCDVGYFQDSGLNFLNLVLGSFQSEQLIRIPVWTCCCSQLSPSFQTSLDHICSSCVCACASFYPSFASFLCVCEMKSWKH
jgi:hypothetical protein